MRGTRRPTTAIEGAEFARENGLMFRETSAKTAQNVEEAIGCRRPSRKQLRKANEKLGKSKNT